MAVSVSAQTMVFIVSVCVGTLLGVLYDVFRITRLAIRSGWAVVIIQDIMYLLACTIVTFIFMLRVNSGEIRFFIVVGEILGAVVYFLTLSILVMRISSITIDAIIRFNIFLRSLILPPMKRVYTKIDIGIDLKGAKVKRMLIKENKLMRIRLKVAQKMLYNLVYVKKAKKEAATKS